MIPYENNLKRKCPSPLQFELIVSKQEQYETIFKLREKAKALFSKTTKVFRILDEACVPSLTCDPLLDVKLLGQGLFIKNKRILTVYPKSIVGFGFLLPTNKVAYLALATYPEYLKKDEETIKVPYNGNAVWSGLIETFTRICGDCSLNCDKCVEGHELCCELLQEADNIGALQEVKDQTDFWTTRNTESLVQLGRRNCSNCFSESF